MKNFNGKCMHFFSNYTTFATNYIKNEKNYPIVSHNNGYFGPRRLQ